MVLNDLIELKTDVYAFISLIKPPIPLVRFFVFTSTFGTTLARDVVDDRGHVVARDQFPDRELDAVPHHELIADLEVLHDHADVRYLVAGLARGHGHDDSLRLGDPPALVPEDEAGPHDPAVARDGERDERQLRERARLGPLLHDGDGVLSVARPVDEGDDGVLAGGRNSALARRRAQERVHVRRHDQRGGLAQGHDRGVAFDRVQAQALRRHLDAEYWGRGCIETLNMDENGAVSKVSYTYCNRLFIHKNDERSNANYADTVPANGLPNKFIVMSPGGGGGGAAVHEDQQRPDRALDLLQMPGNGRELDPESDQWRAYAQVQLLEHAHDMRDVPGREPRQPPRIVQPLHVRRVTAADFSGILAGARHGPEAKLQPDTAPKLVHSDRHAQTRRYERDAARYVNTPQRMYALIDAVMSSTSLPVSSDESTKSSKLRGNGKRVRIRSSASNEETRKDVFMRCMSNIYDELSAAQVRGRDRDAFGAVAEAHELDRRPVGTVLTPDTMSVTYAWLIALLFLTSELYANSGSETLFISMFINTPSSADLILDATQVLLTSVIFSLISIRVLLFFPVPSTYTK
ncbi:hypothetical protein DL768_001114 [Monosporascus sp. mg162]|nr:hypothetical protein DL768_001114 [Monosporascus sp. mg162]